MDVTFQRHRLARKTLTALGRAAEFRETGPRCLPGLVLCAAACAAAWAGAQGTALWVKSPRPSLWGWGVGAWEPSLLATGRGSGQDPGTGHAGLDHVTVT